MVYKLIHVSLLIEVGEAFRETIHENTRIRRFNVYEWVGPVLATDWNEGLAYGRFRTRCELAVFFVCHCLRGCAIDADFAKQSTMCEQLAPEKKRKRSSDCDVDAIFDICEYRDEDTSKEDQNLQR